MDALIQKLVEALVLARLALDHADVIHGDITEITRAKDLAEAAIQAAIEDGLNRALSRNT